MVDLCVVGDGVAVTCTYISDGYGQSICHLKRGVLGTLSPKSALIIAPPGEDLAKVGEGDCVHAATCDFQDGACRVEIPNVEEWDLPRALDFAGLVIAEA